eukprot:3427686-Rhodomonas_salina.1
MPVGGGCEVPLVRAKAVGRVDASLLRRGAWLVHRAHSLFRPPLVDGRRGEQRPGIRSERRECVIVGQERVRVGQGRQHPVPASAADGARARLTASRARPLEAGAVGGVCEGPLVRVGAKAVGGVDARTLWRGAWLLHRAHSLHRPGRAPPLVNGARLAARDLRGARRQHTGCQRDGWAWPVPESGGRWRIAAQALERGSRGLPAPSPRVAVAAGGRERRQ